MPAPANYYHLPSDEPIDQRVLTERVPSVGHLFRDRVAATPDGPAYLYPDANEEWQTLTWAQTRDTVYDLAAGLIGLGVEAEQRVAIASSTRIEWALADLANMCAGAATTTIYPTTIPDDVAFILQDSGTVVVFAENAEQVDKLRGIRDQIPGVTKVVVFDGDGDGDWVTTWAELQQLGQEILGTDDGAVDARIDDCRPEHLATIIYTSGTTGRPKGVRLLHKTWTYQAANVTTMENVNTDDVQFLWLPLAHVFGKQLLTFPIQVGFPTAIDGRVDKIVDNLAVVKPTFMGAAPRIFEKVYAGITMMMEQEGGLKLKLFNWASDVGRRVADLESDGKKATGLLAVQYAITDRLIGAKIRERFGGNVRFFISGSAALNLDISRWFYGMGLKIAEGYGLTESSSAAFVNRLAAFKIGSVGWPVPGTEVKIAEDGEVLLRGEGIMEGYHNNPEATAEVIDADGWFHTGDIGELDERGFLKLTDRKKDLFKTSGGKYVAPSTIESTFKGICPYVAQLVVYGAERNFVSALVTLDPDAMQGWAAANGMADKSYAEIVTSPQAREMVQGYIDELNAGLNRWETIKRFTILDKDLTIEDGELTPSMKLKRKVVSEKYKDLLDSHYES
ncbi:MAG TPA: long-chain fatty acid--CoA ligase [Intrasporangiaceae bacterium]|nr:long-chain fatty acid--CoA ligase [Intrasporangiaceae bacterium]